MSENLNIIMCFENRINYVENGQYRKWKWCNGDLTRN